METGGAHRPDYMDDEQLLVIETEKGLSIFAGCSHPGIVNCVEYVRKCLPGRPIYSLVAGMHLLNSPRARVEQTIEALRAMDIPVLVPVHCTGHPGYRPMKEAFGESAGWRRRGWLWRFENAGVGKIKIHRITITKLPLNAYCIPNPHML